MKLMNQLRGVFNFSDIKLERRVNAGQQLKFISRFSSFAKNLRPKVHYSALIAGLDDLSHGTKDAGLKLGSLQVVYTRKCLLTRKIIFKKTYLLKFCTQNFILTHYTTALGFIYMNNLNILIVVIKSLQDVSDKKQILRFFQTAIQLLICLKQRHQTYRLLYDNLIIN